MSNQQHSHLFPRIEKSAATELQKCLLYESEVSLYFVIFRKVLRVRFKACLALGVWVFIIPDGLSMWADSTCDIELLDVLWSFGVGK